MLQRLHQHHQCCDSCDAPKSVIAGDSAQRNFQNVHNFWPNTAETRHPNIFM